MAAARATFEPLDEDSLHDEAERFLPRQPLPAWLMSLVLHGTVLLLLALTVRGVAPQAPGEEGDRTVGIALRSSSQATPDYFPSPQESGGAEAGGGSLQSSQALPSGDEPPVDLGSALPSGSLSAELGEFESALPGAGSLTSSEGPSRPSGGQAYTKVFGAEGVGTKFIYVFDRSGSMDGYGGRPMAAAKAALLSSLEDLESTHQFQIIFYNEMPQEFSLPGETPRLHYGNDRSKELADRFVRGVVAAGGTRHLDALKLAVRMRPDVIFFLTDANEPRLSAEQLAELRRINGGLTTINAIEFGYGPALGEDNFLRQSARQNGGQHVYVDISRLPRD